MVLLADKEKNRAWTRWQILLKWTYFSTRNWKQPLFDQMTHNPPKHTVQINQDVKKASDLEFPLNLSICFYVPVSPSVFLQRRMKASWSPASLLIFKSRPAGTEPQETMDPKNKTVVLMRKTNISWIHSFVVSPLIKLILSNPFPDMLDRDSKKVKSLSF